MPAIETLSARSNIPQFKPGDTVEVTRKMVRKDQRLVLNIGDMATVRSVFQNTSESPQIVDLKVGDDLMIDIVCYDDDYPLRLCQP